MRIAVFCAALTAAMLPASARAQSPALTEAEALARLSADSPRVRAIRAGIDVARADVLAAGRWPNPRVMLDREAVAGITEYLTEWGRPCRSAVTAGCRFARRRRSSMPRPAGRTTRFAGCAPICGWRSRSSWPRRLASASWQPRATVCKVSPMSSPSARRQATPPDSIGFAPNARCWISTPTAPPRRRNARARRPTLAGLLLRSGRSVGAGRRATRPACRPPLPPVDALVERAESTRGELLALRKEIDAAQFAERAADRRRIPEPELVAGTKSSSSAAAISAASFGVQATIAAVRPRPPERALAQARASRPRRGRRPFVSALRGEIAALRAAVVERRETADRYRTAAREQRRARSNGSRRSATTRGSAASSSCSTPIARRRPRASAGRARRGRARRRKSNWNSSADGRFRDDSTTRSSRRWSLRAWRLAAAVAASGTLPKPEAPTLDVTQLDREDRAVHGVSAARRRPVGALRRASHEARDFKRAERRAGPRVEFTPESGGAATVVRRARSRCGPARSASRDAAAGAGPLSLGARSSTRPGSPTATISASITVFADEAAAIAEAEKQPADDPAAIAYLKEQQWTNEFATAPVREAECDRRSACRPSIEPVTGGEAIVAAPAAGRFAADALLSIGDHGPRRARCSGGSSRGSTSGDDRATLAAEVAEAQAALEAARAEQARAERLLAERAVPGAARRRCAARG